jgi:hypothetical protein
MEAGSFFPAFLAAFAGALAAAFLNSAHRLRAASAIALRPAALILRFARAAGLPAAFFDVEGVC